MISGVLAQIFFTVGHFSPRTHPVVISAVPECLFGIDTLSSWRRQWHPTPVLLPGKSHGGRSLVGYNRWGRKESDMTERLLCVSVCVLDTMGFPGGASGKEPTC